MLRHAQHCTEEKGRGSRTSRTNSEIRHDGFSFQRIRYDYRRNLRSEERTPSEPWGGEILFKPLNDRVYEYACHEGNYALSNILSGERYQERLEAEEKAGAR